MLTTLSRWRPWVRIPSGTLSLRKTSSTCHYSTQIWKSGHLERVAPLRVRLPPGPIFRPRRLAAKTSGLRPAHRRFESCRGHFRLQMFRQHIAVVGRRIGFAVIPGRTSWGGAAVSTFALQARWRGSTPRRSTQTGRRPPGMPKSRVQLPVSPLDTGEEKKLSHLPHKHEFAGASPAAGTYGRASR